MRLLWLFVPFLLSSIAAQDDPGELRRQARALLEQADLQAAIAVLDRWVALEPESASAYAMRAFAKGRSGEFVGGVADASRAIELDPADYRGYHERAFCLGRQEKYRAALADYDRAAELAPRHAGIHGERGDTLRELREPHRAIEAYSSAIQLAPDWAEAYTGRGRVWRSLADFEAARVDFVRSTELKPGDAPVWFLRSGAEFDRGDDETALSSAEEFVRRLPAYARASGMALHGRLAWRIGRDELAIELLEGAATLARESKQAPVAVDALLSLSCVQLVLGELAEARSSLATAEKLQVQQLALWVALMQWAVDSKTDGVEVAGGRLESALEDTSLGLSEFERGLVAICTGTADLEPGTLSNSGNPSESCPRVFLGAWRARCEGERGRSDELLLRCVNTGAKDWKQWVTAVGLLRKTEFGASLRPSLGAELETSEGDGRVILRILSVDPVGAAAQQGLQAGDEIVQMADRPLQRDSWESVHEHAREGLDLILMRRRDGKEESVRVRLGLAPP